MSSNKGLYTFNIIYFYEFKTHVIKKMKKQDIINKIKSTDIKRVVIKTLNNGDFSRSEEEFKDKDFNNHYIKINSLNINYKNIKSVHESGKQIILKLTDDTRIYLKKFTIKQLIYKHSSQLF